MFFDFTVMKVLEDCTKNPYWERRQIINEAVEAITWICFNRGSVIQSEQGQVTEIFHNGIIDMKTTHLPHTYEHKIEFEMGGIKVLSCVISGNKNCDVYIDRLNRKMIANIQSLRNYLMRQRKMRTLDKNMGNFECFSETVTPDAFY